MLKASASLAFCGLVAAGPASAGGASNQAVAHKAGTSAKPAAGAGANAADAATTGCWHADIRNSSENQRPPIRTSPALAANGQRGGEHNNGRQGPWALIAQRVSWTELDEGNGISVGG
jgi:hypothetical protein